MIRALPMKLASAPPVNGPTPPAPSATTSTPAPQDAQQLDEELDRVFSRNVARAKALREQQKA